jgi:hypothetical protein
LPARHHRTGCVYAAEFALKQDMLCYNILLMPRLSRHDASLVIAMLRSPTTQHCSHSRRLLQRLENALAASINGVRDHRRKAHATSAKRASATVKEEP